MLRRTLASNWFYVVLMIALIILPHAIGWVSGDSPFGVRGRPVGQSIYWQGILIEVFVLAVLAMSYNLVFGFTGVISFGHALFFGIGGYILGVVLEYTDLTGEVGLLIGIGLTLIISAVLGLVIGMVTLRLRGVYFAMFTLAVAEMFYIFFSRLALTRAEDGFALTELPVWIDPTRSRLTFYYIALALLAATFLFIRRLIFSPTGAVLLAVRENEERARTIGFDTLRFKLLAITLAGMIASLAGLVQVILNKKVGPEVLNVSNTIDPLLMTIIGGAGTFTGPVIGAAGLHLGDRLLRDLVIEVGGASIDIGANWALILGIVFILVVLVFPYGIVGTFRRWRTKQAK
ncbi:MAG: branched-chain amino acid ABC transporter permease [Anaerolineae bacterium]|nr:branched-chain amino acid ABC transporter permease [Anaerolineae bacterium]NUQ02868.1 branched-chain amino acid ABC transporter permease [Anaerolineae bacterium]